MFKYLTGVKPTGEFHLGNYVNTIKPILDQKLESDTLFLIADYHALTSNNDEIRRDKINIAKILLSFGIENVIFQSDFNEIFELNWILSCFTPKGLMNRAHAYKDRVEENRNKDLHEDKNINMGLYNYPILMTSDLTIFDCEKVFIGSDQLQHIEMANDITQRFNSITRSQVLKIPEPVQQGHNILGFDGNKMSKSYNNSIPIMCSSKKLKKHIFSIKTNSKNLGESKYWDESPITSIFEAFATKREIENLKEEMLYGKGWGEVKTEVFQKVNDKLQIPRQKYHEFENDEVFEIINETYLDLKPQINIKMDEIKEKLFATN